MLLSDAADKLRKMKAGPILSFARERGLDEAQLRRWRSNGGLHFGTPSEVEGAHPSYHLCDAAIVLLVIELRRRGVPVSDIPHIANLANPRLFMLCERLLEGRQLSGHDMKVILDLSGGETRFLTRESDDFAELFRYSGLLCVLFFDLEAIALHAYQQLASALNISPVLVGAE